MQIPSRKGKKGKFNYERCDFMSESGVKVIVCLTHNSLSCVCNKRNFDSYSENQCQSFLSVEFVCSLSLSVRHKL